MIVAIIDEEGRVRYLGKHTSRPDTADWWGWMYCKANAYRFESKLDIVKTMHRKLFRDHYLNDVWLRRQIDMCEE